jgi:hypothetical protein
VSYLDFVKFSAGLAALLLFAAPIAPVVYYMRTAWSVRRSEIVGDLSHDGIALYFRQYYTTITAPDDEDRRRKFFEDYYGVRYGRRHFYLPLAFLVGISAILSVFVMHAAFGLLTGSKETGDFSPIVLAAVAGGFMGAMIDVIGRARTHDLSPTDVYWMDLRLALSIPFGIAFTSIIKDDAGVPLAFFLGAFPVRELLKYARTQAEKRLGIAPTDTGPPSELMQLQGITPAIVDRLSDEGVSTALQLGYIDPIDLTIRTNLGFGFAIDIVSQAIAWLYFGKDMDACRRYGLRGSYEIQALVNSLNLGDGYPYDRAKATLENLAAELKLNSEVLQRSLCDIAANPYAVFIHDIW